MKANNKFVRADDAVSPVIGVILMVAITVVLAAVVFVLVSNLSEQDDQAPNMAFSKDNAAGNVTVVKAPAAGSAVAWSDLSLGGTCEPNAVNGGSTQTGNVAAGDIIAESATAGCTSGETLTVSHIPTGTLLYSTTFS